MIDRLNRYYRQTKVQPYGNYPASIQAAQRWERPIDAWQPT